MSKYFIFMVLFTLSSFGLLSEENDIKLSFHKYTSDQVKNSQKLWMFSKFDPETFKTIVFIENLEKEKKYVFKMQREQVGERDPTALQKFTGQQLYDQAGSVNLSQPFLCVSSRGFLPGEKVQFFLTSEDEKIEKKFTIIPSPLEWKSSIDKASIEITLGSLVPAMYLIDFKDFPENETLTFVSVSKNEQMRTPIFLKKNAKINHMPAVIGFNGGLNKCWFERSNGEKISFILPWGEEFISIVKTGSVSANADKFPEDPLELPLSNTSSPQNCELPSLTGKVVDQGYYAQTQDVLLETKACSVNEKPKLIGTTPQIKQMFPKTWMAIPFISPAIPSHYSCEFLCDGYDAIWGEKVDLEKIKNNLDVKMSLLIKSPVFSWRYSLNVAQRGPKEFSGGGRKEIEEGLAQMNFKLIDYSTHMWGEYPVSSVEAVNHMGEKMRCAWIGLNRDGLVMIVRYYVPHNSKERNHDIIWENFISSTKGLRNQELLEAGGMDVQEGYTIYTVGEATIRVEAEKTKGTGKFYVKYFPLSEGVYFEINDVANGIMKQEWRQNEPCLIVSGVLTELRGNGSNITETSIIVFPKEVGEPSFCEDDLSVFKL